MYAVLARVVAAVLVFFQQTSYWSGPAPGSTNKPVASRFTQQQHQFTGLILARGGSKGIPHKNMKYLNNFPLIHWSLDAMIKSGVFHEIWVSTDDPEIKDYALTLGVQVHDRAPYTATDHATSMLAVQEFVQSHPATQYVALVQCTSPFIRPKYLHTAVERIMRGNCDSVFSASKSHQLRWSVALNDHFVHKPLNFDPKKRPRRQDWHGEFVENGMFYFSPRKLIEEGAFQNERSCVVEIPKYDYLEIDTEEDLKIAEILMKHSHQSKNDHVEL